MPVLEASPGQTQRWICFGKTQALQFDIIVPVALGVLDVRIMRLPLTTKSDMRSRKGFGQWVSSIVASLRL
jgi:hypothetical protein